MSYIFLNIHFVKPYFKQQLIATIDWSIEALYLSNPVIQDSNINVVLLIATQVTTETGNPISMADDGSLIMFVKKDHNLRAIHSEGAGKEVVSSDGVWISITLSPNSMMLAATTTLTDMRIYIFDRSGNDNHKKIRLCSPTSQEDVSNYTTVLADAMDWNLTSEYLIFDSFTSIPRASGGNLEYWSINILDPANEIITMLFQPQSEGVSIGNPSFGQANDINFVFDYVDKNQGTDQIRAANLFTGDVFLIEGNGNSIGYPRYSPDDRNLVFQRWEFDGMNAFPTLRQIALAETKTEPVGSSLALVNEGMLPAWFASGSNKTDVESPDEARPTEFYLAQNYLNPFNPETVIEYRPPLKGKVTLTVYNILGNEIAVLAQGEQEPGTHRIVFDSSNLPSVIYLYRLEAQNVM